MSWPEFVDQLCEIGGCRPESITPQARIVEDLGFDSLEVTEVVMWLAADATPDQRWEHVTVGELFEQWASARA
jgi:acyl carrier protein